MRFMFIKRDYCAFTERKVKKRVDRPYNYSAFSSSSKSI